MLEIPLCEMPVKLLRFWGKDLLTGKHKTLNPYTLIGFREV